jgi:hypothetical protein
MLVVPYFMASEKAATGCMPYFTSSTVTCQKKVVPKSKKSPVIGHLLKKLL